ncbi:MAG: hypothetical protein JKY29_08105 [Gammaproteobacteria bacterium]|nr:hypothetical protein [Gammaproteobacteria bacterium]
MHTLHEMNRFLSLLAANGAIWQILLRFSSTSSEYRQETNGRHHGASTLGILTLKLDYAILA